MSSTPFADLVRNGDWHKVTQQIKTIVYNSFVQDQRRQATSLILIPGREVRMTQGEIRRRVQICEKWIRVMRGDMGFGLIKTMDLLGTALRTELDGKDYEPQKGAWSSTETDQAFISDEERANGIVKPLVKGNS